jgi:hypothetical protein
MQLISTKALVDGVHEEAGLFETILRFDRSSRTLLVGQRPWPNASQQRDRQWAWQPLMTQTESVQITVFDEQHRHLAWDLQKNRGLPRAVTIHITVSDEQGRHYDFERTTGLTIDIPDKKAKQNPDNNLFMYETLDI